MTQAMIMMGVLVICAVSGVLLARRPGRTPGPDEPTGSCAAPAPPAPDAPPAAVAVPGKPAQPLPAARPTPLSVAPSAPTPTPTPTPAPAPAADPAPAVRRARNSGFNRFAPAAGPLTSARCRTSHR
ncbi:hypothetical protein GCM10020358_39750 [Amorphoplanes nipponensis]|uniref:Uncharacterized protein n=1 Tax=Actinoplanes nipponensis TaxID=135950 RepID=A0A919JKA0_9ACTN|nr:hypothetical protein [Actinoplanes nipponensis]GIE50987.1 hypothetical protein Ani05nite_45210 [Actinoplanes nipponensis]